METIEDRIRQELARIATNINSCSSRKLIFYYLYAYGSLSEFIIENNLSVPIPAIDYSYDFFNHIDEMDDAFYDNYNLMHKTDLRIAKSGETLYDRYGLLMLGKYTETLTAEDAIKISRDFFKQYDNDIYDFFEYLLKHSLIRFTDVDDCMFTGMTYDINTWNQSLINVYQKEDITLAGTLIHETMHAYVRHCRRSYSFMENIRYEINSLSEVYSEFIELVFLDYLASIKFSQSDILAYGSRLNAVLISDLEGFKEIITTRFVEEMIDDVRLFNTYQDLVSYVYGKIIAHLYHCKYADNKGLVKQEILHLLLDSARYGKKYLLNNYGFHEQDLYNEKKLIKAMKKYYNY